MTNKEIEYLDKNKYPNIVFINENKEVLAMISDDEIIEKSGYKIIVETNNEPLIFKGIDGKIYLI